VGAWIKLDSPVMPGHDRKKIGACRGRSTKNLMRPANIFLWDVKCPITSFMIIPTAEDCFKLLCRLCVLATGIINEWLFGDGGQVQ